MKWSSLYGEWGNLLYAMAKCDGSISASEREQLKEVIDNELATFTEMDEFDTPVAAYVQTALDYADDEIMDSEDAKSSFLEFVDRHQSALTPEVIKRMICSLTKIAAAYYGINQQEKELLKETKQKLLKILNENYFTNTTSS